jgi:acid phosphatase (class A)
MRILRYAPIVSVFLLISLGLAPAQQNPGFISPADFDFAAILGNPPADDSQEHHEEVDRMLALQAARTPEQEQRCKSEEKVTPFVFAEVLGPSFNDRDLPLTAKLFREVTRETTQVVDVPKKKWSRVRPPLADPRIHPCVALEHTGSFPSGHATRGIVWATLVAEIFADERQKLMDRGRLIGQDRVIGGMHYPSDVAAGQKLGAAIARKFLASDTFETEFAKVKKECHTHLLVPSQ